MPLTHGLLAVIYASDVLGQTYDFVVRLVREFGAYPLNLGEFDENM